MTIDGKSLVDLGLIIVSVLLQFQIMIHRKQIKVLSQK